MKTMKIFFMKTMKIFLGDIYSPRAWGFVLHIYTRQSAIENTAYDYNEIYSVISGLNYNILKTMAICNCKHGL